MKNGLEYIRRFLKSTGILSVGVILPKVVVFFLLSYNTAHIGTSEYGYYDLSVSYATMFSYLLFFDIWITTMRFLYERENPEDRDRIVRSGASIFFFSCIAYGAVACLIGFFLAPDYLAETVLYGLTQNLVSFYTFSARGFRRDLDFAVSGLIGNPGQANYSTSKAGVVGLTKSTAQALVSRGVRCNAVAPGFIATDMTANLSKNNKLVDMIPMKRMGTADEVADLIFFLASDASSYITGEIIKVDGGVAI